MIDWAKITTDLLLEHIPDSEDNRSEYKAEGLMEDDNKFKNKIGKQVSAFANSGGGHIILGLSDDRKWQVIPDQRGSTSTKDWLARVVADSVDYPLQSFNLHRVPHTGDATKAVYVIEIRDSPATPHQNRADKIYYRRIDGHSDRSEHFYTELLRNRFTKAILEIERMAGKPVRAHMPSGYMEMKISVRLKNISKQATQQWGLFGKSVDNGAWSIAGDDTFTKGVWISAIGSPIILPGETRTVSFEIHGALGRNIHSCQAFLEFWRKVAIEFFPVSDNHTGERFVLGNWTDGEWHNMKYGLEDEINQAVLKPQ